MSETQTDTTEAPTDIRSMLGAAFEEHEAAAPEAPAKPVQDAPEAPEQSASQRTRDERGRYAEEAKAAAAATAAPTDAAPDTATEAAPAAEAEFSKATAMWSAADRELASKLPKDQRDFLVRRHRDMEADYTRKMQPVAELRQRYEPIDQIFAPHQETMRQKGLTIPGMVQAWANVEQSLLDPGSAPQMVAQIMRGYNIDPRNVLHTLGVPLPEGVAAPQQQQQPSVHPEVARQLQMVQQYIRSQEQQSRSAEETRITNDINSFASATDSAGALLHPYFADVEAEMARLAKMEMDQGTKPDLSKLYDAAVWMNTSTRDRMLSGQRAATEAQQAAESKRRNEEARAKAGQARRASASVTGSPGPARQTAGSNGSLRAMLEEAVNNAA